MPGPHEAICDINMNIILGQDHSYQMVEPRVNPSSPTPKSLLLATLFCHLSRGSPGGVCYNWDSNVWGYPGKHWEECSGTRRDVAGIHNHSKPSTAASFRPPHPGRARWAAAKRPSQWLTLGPSTAPADGKDGETMMRLGP